MEAIPSRNLLLDERVNHLLAEVVDGLHVGRLDSHLADLVACARRALLDRELYHLYKQRQR